MTLSTIIAFVAGYLIGRLFPYYQEQRKLGCARGRAAMLAVAKALHLPI